MSFKTEYEVVIKSVAKLVFVGLVSSRGHGAPEISKRATLSRQEMNYDLRQTEMKPRCLAKAGFHF